MLTSLNWGILATGGIARNFAREIAGSAAARLVAVGSRTQAAADQFAAEHGGVKAHGSYEALLADPQVQAIYVATPHPGHHEWVLKAAAAGKHMICEKPLAMNLAEAQAMVAAARQHRVVLAEAFVYRCHPQTARLVELLRTGAIGELRSVQACFTLKFDVPLTHRIFARELGGGGILDLGCYPVSWVRHMVGAALGRGFADPLSVKGGGKLHAITRVDEYAAATLSFEQGITAQVTCGTTVPEEITARLVGTGGTIDVPFPYHPGRPTTPSRIVIHRHGAAPLTEQLPPDPVPLFARLAAAVGEAAAAGTGEVGVMSLADTLGNTATLDAWLREVGVRYDA